MAVLVFLKGLFWRDDIKVAPNMIVLVTNIILVAAIYIDIKDLYIMQLDLIKLFAIGDKLNVLIILISIIILIGIQSLIFAMLYLLGILSKKAIDKDAIRDAKELGINRKEFIIKELDTIENYLVGRIIINSLNRVMKNRGQKTISKPDYYTFRTILSIIINIFLVQLLFLIRLQSTLLLITTAMCGAVAIIISLFMVFAIDNWEILEKSKYFNSKSK